MGTPVQYYLIATLYDSMTAQSGDRDPLASVTMVLTVAPNNKETSDQCGSRVEDNEIWLTHFD